MEAGMFSRVANRQVELRDDYPKDHLRLGLAFGFPRSRPKRQRMKLRIYGVVLRPPIRRQVSPDVAASRTHNAAAQ